MRRSICQCEPATATASQIGTWKFVYTTANDLPKGAKVKFDLLSEGRAIDWEIPETNLKKAENVIFGILPNGKQVEASEIELEDRYAPQYEFVLPSDIKAGESFTICIGCPKASKKKDQGSQTQLYSQRRRAFHIYVDPKGKGRYGDPEIFSMDIKGGELSQIRILTPSFVGRNRRFDLVVRFEDEFGNLTHNAPDDTLVELYYEHLRENLNWKLFVPETGFIALPNLYFNESGTYTIHLRNCKTGEVFKSAPIRCFDECESSLFWGVLHGESERYDSTENIESCLRSFRDEHAIQFFATSPFENEEETPNEVWRHVAQNISEFDESERFTTFLGFQWIGDKKEEGCRQIVYAKEGKPLMRRKDAKSSSLKKLYKTLAPKEAISIPCFTMADGYQYDFKQFNPEFERVVEIYNAWGSSECTKKEGNPFPIICSGKKGIKETAEGSIQEALEKNLRFGFVAGGLDDRGIYADFYESDQEQYYPGLTAVIASDHNRSGIFEALYNRSCYATTGERIILGLFCIGKPMGSEISSADKPGLLVNRHLTGYVAGTKPITKAEIIRNGKVIKTFSSETYHLDFEFDDLTSLDSVSIKPGEKAPPFVYYYLRVTQEDGHMAWSSPIWIDQLPPSKSAVPPKKLAATKTAKIMDDEEDFDNDEE